MQPPTGPDSTSITGCCLARATENTPPFDAIMRRCARTPLWKAILEPSHIVLQAWPHIGVRHRRRGALVFVPSRESSVPAGCICPAGARAGTRPLVLVRESTYELMNETATAETSRLLSSVREPQALLCRAARWSRPSAPMRSFTSKRSSRSTSTGSPVIVQVEKRTPIAAPQFERVAEALCGNQRVRAPLRWM